MDADTRTHKNENSVSIFLPALNHLVVFIICSLGVHREERTGAVTEVELPMQWRIRCRLRMNDVLIRYKNSEISGESRSGDGDTCLAQGCHPPDLGDQFEALLDEMLFDVECIPNRTQKELNGHLGGLLQCCCRKDNARQM